MSVERISLDANILFYTVDADAGARHEDRAGSLENGEAFSFAKMEMGPVSQTTIFNKRRP